MKIATVLRNDDYTREVENLLKEKLKEAGSSYTFVNGTDEEPDMVLSIGGDGTLLEAVHQYGME